MPPFTRNNILNYTNFGIVQSVPSPSSPALTLTYTYIHTCTLSNLRVVSVKVAKALQARLVLREHAALDVVTPTDEAAVLRVRNTLDLREVAALRDLHLHEAPDEPVRGNEEGLAGRHTVDNLPESAHAPSEKKGRAH